jgi:hypothetical protein
MDPVTFASTLSIYDDVPTRGRAGVLYHRYDGHYGLLSPAG